MKFRNIHPLRLERRSKAFLSIAIIAMGIIGFWKRPIETNTPSGNSVIGTVIRVADGDTLTIERDGVREKVRLCGIDAPEKAQPLGKESKQSLEKMTLGKQVAFIPVERDRFGRTVAEVFVLGNPEHFINGDLVQAGLAYHYARFSGNCPNRIVIEDAENIARSKRTGVWADTRAVKPWDYRKAQ